MKKLFLTERALNDLQNVYDYSVDQWGEKVALRYIQSIEECFLLLQNNTGLLKINKNISSRFIAYPVQKHILICDIVNDTICILTVRHSSMNLMEQLKKLQPTLDEEAKALFKKIK
ncbi:MAG: type II toxin-antitoxin system RelE/ParE family toxin [Flavobacteriaceae bacterium]|nr:type II toxin-antitoxin system RelE/ParE family toxin [Flavobacteriaceae bacterium]